MSQRALGALVLACALLAGCGGAQEAEAPDDVTDTAGETGSPSDPTDAPATDDAEPPSEDGEPTVLLGSVGTPEDPEAFVISLTDESGEPVTTLPAGDYVIEVSDPAEMHNFHLTGGSVDETTSVPGIEETTFEVTLEPGEYTYRCDPHPPMTGTFTVT